MHFFARSSLAFSIVVLFGSLSCIPAARAVMDPRFELNVKTVENLGAQPAHRHARSKASKGNRHRGGRSAAARNRRHSGSGGGVADNSGGFGAGGDNAAPVSDREAISRVKEIWGTLMPAGPKARKLPTIQSPTFSLNLDPGRYPELPTMDGGWILLDQGGSIPPLVRSLIEEKDPSVRIVSESTADAKKFLGAVLEPSGFYSVEEDFRLEFGEDPKLTVSSDFKVERTAESLIKQDVFLLNSGRQAMQANLRKFLGKNGFTVFEPFALPAGRKASPPPQSRILQITTGDQPGVVDAVLNALTVQFQRNQRLQVFAEGNSGISLTIKADRCFERGGRRYVVTRFDGDPVTYTLFRILETKGYRIIMLEPQDDFRKVTEKILSVMGIGGAYAQYRMWPVSGANCSLEMSGFKLEGAGIPGGSLFLTNLPLDRIVIDLLKDNGYSVQASERR